MGWLFPYGATRREVIDDLTRDQSNDERVFRTLKKCLRGNTLYTLHESGPVGATKKWIGVYLLAKNGGDWGYKDMDETVGPCYYDCPPAYLDAADEPANDWAREWREKCRESAAKKAEQTAKRPKVGEVWSCHGGTCKKIRIAKVKGRCIEAYNLSPGGGYFRIPKKILGERVDDAPEVASPPPAPGHVWPWE